MQRPNSTFHGMNPQERESKLSALRFNPLGPRNVVDPSVFLLGSFSWPWPDFPDPQRRHLLNAI